MSMARMGRVDGKVALVTGGASGIGRASCRRLAEEGALVVVADIAAEGAERVAAEIGENAMARRLDVASEPDWEAAVEAAIAWGGRLDIVCNIAGIGSLATIEDTELSDWNAMLAVNLTGTMLGCKHGIRAIVRSGGSGAIVNMSSIGGLSGAAEVASYTASKGGVTMLTKSVAMHCAERRYPIRCVSIHPTYVNSEMLDPLALATGTTRDALAAEMGKLVPIGRMATPEDVAAAVLFAASNEAAMISGSAIIVDGAHLAAPWGPRY